MNSKAAKAEDDKWRAESDMRTLIEAEKIKGDKTRFDAAMKCSREQRKAMESIDTGKKG